MPFLPATTSRREVTSPDGIRLSVLLAEPPPGVLKAAHLPPVLAVHGFASSAHSGWQRTGHLDALTRAGRVVIAPDLRGHGESDRPHDQRDYTLAAVLADLVTVVSTLADRSGRPGSATVTAPAGRAEQSEPVAVTGSTGRPSDGGRCGPVDLLGYSLGARLCWTVALRGLIPVRRMVLGGFDGRPLFDGVDTERLDRLAAGVPSNDREALRCLVSGLAGTGGTPSDLAGANLPGVPTLLVAGDRDPLATGGRALADRLPWGAFLSVPGRNHISAVPAAAFRAAVVEFLGAVGHDLPGTPGPAVEGRHGPERARSTGSIG